MSKRKANPIAKELRTPKYRMRVGNPPKKGKGSYKRETFSLNKAAKSGFILF